MALRTFGACGSCRLYVRSNRTPIADMIFKSSFSSSIVGCSSLFLPRYPPYEIARYAGFPRISFALLLIAIGSFVALQELNISKTTNAPKPRILLPAPFIQSYFTTDTVICFTLFVLRNNSEVTSALKVLPITSSVPDLVCTTTLAASARW